MKIKQLRCPSCGAGIDLDIKGHDFVFCPYCGSQFSIDDGNRTITKNININRYTHKRYTDDAAVERVRAEDRQNEREHKFNKWVLIGAVLFLIADILFLAISFSKDERERDKSIEAGMIEVGQASEDMIGKNYQTIVAQLESAGFKNISTIDLDDAVILFRPSDTVESVSIGGKTTFYEHDLFAPETEIIISYH